MRGYVLVALLPALLLSACASEQPQAASDAEEDGGCQPVEQPPLQAGQHLIGDQGPPAPYSSSPPTSGWHASGAFELTVQDRDDPLPEPKQVSVLEAGGVVVAYHDLPEEDREDLEEHVRANHDGRAAVTAYDQLDPGHVAYTAWSVVQHCNGLDLPALDAFIAAYAEEEPDVPGKH